MKRQGSGKSPRREYSFQRIYVIICSECNENIVERGDERDITTRAQAEAYTREHERQHRRDESA